MTRCAALALMMVTLTLPACASAPPVTGEACGAARTVLIPVINAVIEEAGAVEIETRTALFPPAAESERWREIRDFGFAPVWRAPGTEAALRTAYWEAWRAIEPERRFDQPDIADREAWEAAYDAVGDDRVFPQRRLWETFFNHNAAGADFTCAAGIAEVTGALLVSADAPRAPGAMRLTPAAPGLGGDRALMAARAMYPAFEAGGPPRETGTIWLLRLTGAGDWRVLSARRVEAMGERRLP